MKTPGEGNGNPLQSSCLENPKDQGTWRVTVYGVTKSWTWLITALIHGERIQHSRCPAGTASSGATLHGNSASPKASTRSKGSSEGKWGHSPERPCLPFELELAWTQKEDTNISRKMNDQRARLYSLSLTCLCISQVLNAENDDRRKCRQSNPEFLFLPVCPDSSVSCCWNMRVLRSEIKTVECVLCSASTAVANTKHKPVDKLQNANCVIW